MYGITPPGGSRDVYEAAAILQDVPEHPQQQQPQQSTENNNNSGSKRRRRRSDTWRVDVAYPRKRATTACRQCRARKIKCNNVRPVCGSCLASQAVCVYGDSQDHSSFDTASILILDQLSQVITRLDRLQGQSPTSPSSGPDGQTATASPGVSPGDSETTDVVENYDLLQIPACQTAADTVLQWPIFGHPYPPGYLIDAVYEAEVEQEDDVDDRQGSQASRSGPGLLVDGEAVPRLVRRFLELVHIKNPIVDLPTLWVFSQRVAEEGIAWDAASCLVLLACALGCVARPFQESPEASSSLASDADGLRRGDAYFNLARRRFGLLQAGILTPQCHFLSGVYLMYTMRPLPAWSAFHAASRSYFLYLRCRGTSRGRFQTDAQALATQTPADLSRRRVEQRLYWSCYKAECEVRTVVDLPNSALAELRYPDMHPSPPDMGFPGDRDAAASPAVDCACCPPGSSPSTSSPSSAPSPPTTLLPQHLQEQSWFYYLTEITLRRMGNNVLNTFYAAHGPAAWTDERMPYLAKAAGEMEQKLEAWYHTLPPPIRYDDDRVPPEELPAMVRGRALEIKSWIYRPFLYYAIHQGPSATHAALVQPFAGKALQSSLHYIENSPNKHRHHGAWFAIRDCTAQILSVLAAVRSRTVTVPPEWQEATRGCLQRMRYWEAEIPGVARMLAVLERFLAEC